MLKKRVIFTLLYDNGAFMLSRNFRLQKVGNIRWLKKNYNFSKIAFSIDELIILDVTRGNRDETRFREHVALLTEECFVPIAAGGGVRSVESAGVLFKSGADKIVVNSLVYENPAVLTDIATEYGQQSIVAAIDIKIVNGKYVVHINNGEKRLPIDLNDWLRKMIELPVGEIYLNSMDRDGTGQGYHRELIEFLPDPMPIPVILSGGAGNYSHLLDGLRECRIDAVATAHLFNFVGDGLETARQKLLSEGVELAKWDLSVLSSLSQSFGSPK